ncbi:hypothetical protein [Vibrio cholerae]|uniref:hypothetical protein n=3 Tax=Vibrio cholerae TaxID=666 RepID=UPI00115A33E5|nr:hypothetical protein [Vibrio cholerae]TQP20801.1 hypothetical protein FLM00_17070 [Vibrio cholerae]
MRRRIEILLLIITPSLFPVDTVLADSLIKNYTIAPRHQTYGVQFLGYPQVCIRTNMPDQRVDMEGILDELNQMYHPTMLLTESTKLAASGKLGHVWTIFFDSEISWKSWSFRFPGTTTGNALFYKNWYDSPERNFNFQYCVSMKNQPTDDAYLIKNFVEPLVEESKQIASALYPNIHFTNAVYSPATPCVWFATKLFNKVTGLDIPFEQELDWKKIANIINEPTFATLKSIPDSGVVAEAISKKIKNGLAWHNLNVLFTHNRDYLKYSNNTLLAILPIEFNSLGGAELRPHFDKFKSGFLDGTKLYLFNYRGNVFLFDILTKKFDYQDIPMNQVFNNVSFDPKSIRATMPIYFNMPHYIESVNQYLIFLENGDTYLMNSSNKQLRKVDYFQSYAPHLVPYTKRILGISLENNNHVLVYLSDRKYIEVDLATLEIVGRETRLEDHPTLGHYFKLH